MLGAVRERDGGERVNAETGIGGGDEFRQRDRLVDDLAPAPVGRSDDTTAGNSAARNEGEYLGKEAEFQSLVQVRPGEPFRGEAVTATAKAFTERFGQYGYAFARVDQRPEIDRANGQVVVVLMAAPQRRVYVRRIEVAGNSRTRDEVIRREFRQLEAAWYDATAIRLSKERLNRLGYFGEVEVETSEVASAP